MELLYRQRATGWNILLSRRREGEAWNYGNCVPLSPPPSILFVRREVVPEARPRTHKHRGNVFFFFLHMMLSGNICQSPSSRTEQLHALKLLYEMQFDGGILPAPSTLHEHELIRVYSGSIVLWWLSKVGNVAYDSNIRDIWECTDLSIKQCTHRDTHAHRHTGWLMVPTLSEKPV